MGSSFQCDSVGSRPVLTLMLLLASVCTLSTAARAGDTYSARLDYGWESTIELSTHTCPVPYTELTISPPSYGQFHPNLGYVPFFAFSETKGALGHAD